MTTGTTDPRRQDLGGSEVARSRPRHGMAGSLAGSLALHALAGGAALVLASAAGPDDSETPAGGGRGSGSGATSIVAVDLVGPAVSGATPENVTPPVTESPKLPVAAPVDEPEALTMVGARDVAPVAPGATRAEVAEAPSDATAPPAAPGVDPGRAAVGGGAAAGAEPGPEGVTAGGGEGPGAGPGAGTLTEAIPPTPLHAVMPRRPAGVRAERLKAARVRVRVHVTERGRVDEVELLSGSGTRALDEATLEAARRLRFSPGFVRGIAAAMWTEAEFSF